MEKILKKGLNYFSPLPNPSTPTISTRYQMRRKRRFRSHIKSLELFAEWESDHPQLLRPSAVIACIGYLYQLIPSESRQRDLDMTEIINIRNIFSKLKSRK
jgi:hypothetical protein